MQDACLGVPCKSRATLREVGLVLLKVMVLCLAHVTERRWRAVWFGVLVWRVNGVVLCVVWYCVVLCCVCWRIVFKDLI